MGRSRRKSQNEVIRSIRMWWRREEVLKSKILKVPGTGSQGPRYFKVTFKDDLDSEEGLSYCFYFFPYLILQIFDLTNTVAVQVPREDVLDKVIIFGDN